MIDMKSDYHAFNLMKETKNMKKSIVVFILAAMLAVMLGGCQTQADKVSYNLSKQADNFNVVRQLTVINCLEGDVLFQMTGKMSINADREDNQLEVIVEEEDGTYKKHFVGLSDNVTYVVEDISTNEVSNYKYTLNYNPKMWLPIDIETID